VGDEIVFVPGGHPKGSTPLMRERIYRTGIEHNATAIIPDIIEPDEFLG